MSTIFNPAAAGAFHGLRYIAEANFGATPGTPSMKALRHTSCALGLSKDSLLSQELRPDRQISDFRHGARRVQGDIGFELSYGEFDAILAGALFGAWGASASGSAITVTVDEVAGTFTRAAGSWLLEGVQVGDVLTFSGFAAAGNNGTFVVSAVSALVATFSTATGIVAVAGDTGISYTSTRGGLRAGTTMQSFTFERAFTDVTEYMVFSGCMVDSLTLSVQQNAMVTGAFGIIGKDMGALSGSALDANPTPSLVHSPYDSFSGSLLEGGSAIAVITGIELSLSNALDPAFVLASKAAHTVTAGRSNLTGTVSALFVDDVMMNKFINETETSLILTLGAAGSPRMVFTIPRLKFSGGDAAAADEGRIGISMPFQALYDATEATNLMIARIP
jgi:hypothetical protein